MPSIAREPFLLDIKPDELAYSLVARFCEARQLTPIQFNERYLGSRVTWVSHDVPIRVPDLARLAPNTDARSMVLGHTLLPFLTATMKHRRRSQVVENMAAGRAHYFDMAVSRTTPRPAFLRYCVDCDAENRARYGFTYWERHHQLPTSLVCGRHEKPLHLSPVSTAVGRKIQYTTAGIWGPERPTLIPEWQGARLDRCVRLARLGYRMLDAEYDEPRTSPGLRDLAMRVGYGRGTRSELAMSRLADDLARHDAFLHRIWPNLGPAMSMPFSWIAPHLTPSVAPDRKPAFTWAVLKTFFESEHHTHPPDRDGEVTWDGVLLEQTSRHLDARMSEEDVVVRTHEAAARIRAEMPERRVTRSAIYREARIIQKRVGCSGVADAVEASCETAEQFERRRIRRGIEQLLSDGRSLTVNGVRMVTNAYSYDLIRQEIDAVLQRRNERPEA